MKIHKLAKRRAGRGVAASRGVVLLEALVGIMIFTIGVLGLIGVQAAMTKAQTQANFRIEASQLASDLVGRMWVDTANVGKYVDDASCQSHVRCAQWRTRVLQRMPGNLPPEVTRKGGTIEIVIKWVLPGETDDGGHHQFRTTTAVS